MKINNHIGIFLLSIAIIVGGLLRLYRLGSVPVSLYWDEAAIGYDAYSLLKTGKDMHGNSGFQAIFPSYGDYKLPMYIWLTSVSERFFGPNSFAVRLPSSLAGIGFILVSYGIAYALFNSTFIGGVAGLCASLLPADILFSRTGFEGHLALLFVGLTVWLWLLSSKRILLLGLSSLTAAMAVYSYFSARVVIPLLAGITFLYLWKQTSWQWKGFAIGSLALWFVLLIPIYRSPYYAASNQFRLSTTNVMDVGQFALASNVMRQESGNSFITRILYHRRLLQLRAIVTQLVTHSTSDFVFFYGDSNLRHSTTMVGLLFAGYLPLVLIGLYSLKNKPHLLWWMIGFWIASCIPASLPTEVPHALRSMDAFLVFPLLISLGVAFLWQRKKFFLLGSIVCILLVNIGFFTHDYNVHYPSRSASAWQSGYFELVNYLTAHQSSFTHCTIDADDGRLYLYFLFGNRVDPQTIWGSAVNFVYPQIGAYTFKQVTTLPNAHEWLVVSPDRWISLNQPLADTIRDYAGKPVFYVVKGSL